MDDDPWAGAGDDCGPYHGKRADSPDGDQVRKRVKGKVKRKKGEIEKRGFSSSFFCFMPPALSQKHFRSGMRSGQN